MGLRNTPSLLYASQIQVFNRDLIAMQDFGMFGHQSAYYAFSVACWDRHKSWLITIR